MIHWTDVVCHLTNLITKIRHTDTHVRTIQHHACQGLVLTIQSSCVLYTDHFLSKVFDLVHFILTTLYANYELGLSVHLLVHLSDYFFHRQSPVCFSVYLFISLSIHTLVIVARLISSCLVVKISVSLSYSLATTNAQTFN